MKTRIASTLILAFFLLCPTHVKAQTIALFPAQDPIWEERRESGDVGPGPMSRLVSGCMDRLFEAGMIVSDAPAQSVAMKKWKLSTAELSAAREGLVDLVISLYGTWKPSAYDRKVLIPVQIDWRLIDPADGKVKAKGSVKGPADSPGTAAKADDAARDLGRLLGEVCIKAISSYGRGGQ